MMDALLFSVMGITTYTDLKKFKILNALVYPAILIALYFTYNVLEVLCAFGIMALLLHNKILNWSGGDVKLYMLIAAVKGLMFLPVLVVTALLIDAYRSYYEYKGGLAITPFCFVALIITMLLAVALKKIGFGWVA